VDTKTALLEDDAGAAGADSGVVPAPDSDPPRELPPRVPSIENTVHSIACGAKRCVAGEEACTIVDSKSPSAAPSWACVPLAKAQAAGGAIFECDDGTDCAPGKTCCSDFSSDAAGFACTTRDIGCRVEVCAPGGARCPAGMACRDGECAPEKVPGPKCGKTICTGKTPICHWDGKGECVSAERARELSETRSTQVSVTLLKCTQNADCGATYHCCTGGAMGTSESFCALHCDLMNTVQYCSSDADCPTLHPVGGKPYKMRCRALPGLPPWSKGCGDDP
jgi:hypothetical protein